MWRYWSFSSAGGGVDRFGGDGLRLLRASEGVVFSEEEHAVAFLALAHRNAGAVPEGLGDLGLFVFVMAARAQRSPKVVLVTRQTLQNNGGDTGVSTEIRAGALGVGFSELTDDLQAFCCRLLRGVGHRSGGSSELRNPAVSLLEA